MDEMENKDKVMKLAKKLGLEREFMKYCEENGVDPSADSLKAFLESKGYTQSKLKEMLATKSDDDMEESDEDEDESDKPKGGVTIAIMMGKGGKMPPAWS